jgi:hypothetical protein
MNVVALTLFIIGCVALVVGYRKSNRNILALSALLLLASGALPDFIAGYIDGISGTEVSASRASAG